MKISKHMDGNVIIVDDFFYDPDFVRNKILTEATWNMMDRGYTGYHAHTNFYKGFTLNRLQEIFNTRINPRYGDIFASARYTPYTEDVRAYIHIDRREWNAITYLNPEYPEGNGTAIWRHKETGIMNVGSYEAIKAKFPDNFDTVIGGGLVETADLSKWEKVLTVEGKYNRCAIIRSGLLWHSAEPMHGWGDSPENSRLIHISSFDLEGNK
jgi:hypothetical protein